MSTATIDSTATRRTFWAIAAFYALIAFEFLYMASPFAVYFYSIYGPGLRILNSHPVLGWLSGCFLPHIVVDTKSMVLNLHNVAGIIMTMAGLLGFLIGAVHVYFHKLTKRGAVSGGIYRYLRHPQYAALMLAGLGMLLLWPRYVALLMYVAVVFAYYFLARIEEAECLRKFGPAYGEYRQRTGMFLPFRLPSQWRLPTLPVRAVPRVAAILSSFVMAATLGVMAASGLRSWTLNSLYTIYRDNAVFVSVTRMDDATLRRIVAIAEADSAAQALIGSKEGRRINYIVPANWYISEIPMNPMGSHFAHLTGGERENYGYKIVYSQALLNGASAASGVDLLKQTVARKPLGEVWVDAEQGIVTAIKPPPRVAAYEGIPMPLF